MAHPCYALTTIFSHLQRTFQLFKELQMGFVREPNSKELENYNPKPGDLIQYYMRGVNQPLLFNGVQVIQKEVAKDEYEPPMSAGTFDIPNIPAGLVQLEVDLCKSDWFLAFVTKVPVT
jgi:hypothetical protein